jgi:hypothetical protein
MIMTDQQSSKGTQKQFIPDNNVHFNSILNRVSPQGYKCVLFQRDRRTKSAGSGLVVVDKSSFRRNFTAGEFRKYQKEYLNGENLQVRSMPGTR